MKLDAAIEEEEQDGKRLVLFFLLTKPKVCCMTLLAISNKYNFCVNLMQQAMRW